MRTTKKPWLSFILGFLLSGIALGIYFRSLLDLVVPTAICATGIGLDKVLPSVFGDTLFWGDAVIGGLWGFLRALNSNERLSRLSSN